MRRLIMLVCFQFFFYGFSQNCRGHDGVIPVGNECNSHLIKLPELEFKDGKAKYIFEGVLEDMFKVYIDEKDYQKKYKITGVDRISLNTGIGFRLENDHNLQFAFPVNPEIFNESYWIENHLHERMQNEKLKVKIFVTIYKNVKCDSKTILIDKVELNE